MLSRSEQSVLRTYREYLITPGQMLCFSGQDLERHRTTLEQMSDKELLVKEAFKGGLFSHPSRFHGHERFC